MKRVLRRTADFFRRFGAYTAMAVTCALLLGILVFVFARGLPGITWEFLTSVPSVLHDTVGILPNLLNTFYLVLMTLVIVLPLGVGAAIFLTEYAPNTPLTRVIEFASETLAGIPSIIYGLVGMLIFCEFLGLQSSLLSGAFTLAMMTLPTVIRTTQESLKTVPKSYREGSLALGSGKWHMIRTVVLPGCVDGIVTGAILSIGKIVGESAALLYTAGMAHKLLTPKQALTAGNPGATLTVALYVYAKERGDFQSAFSIAAVLLIFTLLLNRAAAAVGKQMKEGKKK